jgi:glutamate racemase
LPKEDVVYFGDCGRAPYGVKSKETIKNYTFQNVRFLMETDIKLLVIACNTSSAYAYELVKQKLRIPVIEVIQPGARAGLTATKNGKVGVIGTNATMDSGAYIKAIKELEPDVKVFQRACPLFVPLVEEGEFWWDNDVTEKVARVYLDGFREDGIDTLVLGCTHYPLLRSAIQRVMGNDTTLVSSAEEVAISVKCALKEFNIETDRKRAQNLNLFTSDSVEKFEPLCSSILKCRIEDINAVRVNIEEY